MTGLSVLVVGFLLGVQHATEADHLAAVATLVTRQRSVAKTMRQGVAWGVGHMLSLSLFAGAVLMLGRSIPPRMAQGLELAVGIMLVLLGLDVLRRLARQRIHFHVHSHEGGVHHFHAHSHIGTAVHALPHRHEHVIPLRALGVGMMHGMAGSAALILLSLDAQPYALGLAYIGLFGLGSIVGMAMMSVAISIPLSLSAGYVGWLHKGMTAGVGIFTSALGAFMVYRIGFAEGLLSL